MIQVNYVAVALAAAASFGVGFLWYGPLFGKRWLKEMGMTEADAKKEGMNLLMPVKTYIAAFVTAYVLSHFIHYAGAYTLVNGAKTGLWAWLGFVAPLGFISTMYGKKSWNLYYLDYGYHLVSLVVMGAIIAWMY